MKAIKCDKCKQYFDRDLNRYTEISLTLHRVPEGYAYSAFDLCNDCTTEFMRYFGADPK